MSAVIRNIVASGAALALIGLSAAPAEARVHHHHHAAKAAASASKHGHASKSGGHRRHRGAKGGAHAHHARPVAEVVPHPHERHAALCETVVVRHHSTERCRG